MESDKIIGLFLSLFGFIAIVVEIMVLVYLPFTRNLIEKDLLAVYLGLMIPVLIGVLGVALIIIWIGITMLTTPPPQEFDFEEFEAEMKAEEEKAES